MALPEELVFLLDHRCRGIGLAGHPDFLPNGAQGRARSPPLPRTARQTEELRQGIARPHRL